MKTIGLIGGMSWESSLEYYRIINETVKEQLGGLHSAKLIMYSFDFGDIAKLQHQGKWEELTTLMIDTARIVEREGADFIVICTNTMHKMADEVQRNVGIPLLNIIDVTANKIKSEKFKKVGLLGTKFTMKQDFYKRRLSQKHGIEVIIPDEKEQQVLHDVLYNWLKPNETIEFVQSDFKKIIDNLVLRGAEGIILGCTELPLLIDQENYNIPLINTTALHAQTAVKFALNLL